MRLDAGCDLLVEAAEPCPCVGILRPRSGAAQWLAAVRYQLTPHLPSTEHTDDFGNLCQRFVAPAGRTRIRVQVEVHTEADLAVDPEAAATPVGDLPDDVLHFLLPSRYCPSDKIEPRAREVVGQALPGYAQVEAIRHWIHTNLEYRYGVSDASTDALDSLAQGAGVCRDFSHIGIAMCRSLRIPARMVVGWLYQLDPMDLHAWFEAYIGGRWYTFDATQDVPRGGRIVLAYGRDAADVAFLSNYGPLQTVEMQVWVHQLDDELTIDAAPAARAAATGGPVIEGPG